MQRNKKEKEKKSMISFALLIISTIVAVATAGCHPECTTTLNDNVYLSVCVPICSAPACNNTCNDCETPIPQCEVSCPADMCESDQCPQCEILCQAPVCMSVNCTIECAMVQCDWLCHKPTACDGNCTCEAPACAYSSANIIATNSFILLLVFFLVI